MSNHAQQSNEAIARAQMELAQLRATCNTKVLNQIRNELSQQVIDLRTDAMVNASLVEKLQERIASLNEMVSTTVRERNEAMAEVTRLKAEHAATVEALKAEIEQLRASSVEATPAEASRVRTRVRSNRAVSSDTAQGFDSTAGRGRLRSVKMMSGHRKVPTSL